jgi:general secretion pathway protein F
MERAAAMTQRLRYRAARADGSIKVGYLAVEGVHQAYQRLRAQGLVPVDLKLSNDPVRRPEPARSELAVLFRAIASLTAAGLPLEKALAAARRTCGPKLTALVDEALQGLREGRGLGEALGSSGLIPRSVVAVLRAGEHGGHLVQTLATVSDQLEQEVELRAQLRHALVYPAFIATAGLASVLVIGLVVLPRFATLLKDWDQEPPRLTGILLSVSDAVSRSLPWSAVLLLALLIGLAFALRVHAARALLFQFIAKLPLVGDIGDSIIAAAFCRALGGMLSSGMPVLRSLEEAGEVILDPTHRARITRSRDRIAQGESLACALEAEHALPARYLPLIVIGEDSGRLPDLLIRTGDLAAEDARRRLRTAVAVIEPIMIVVFGGIVALTATSLLQAVYALRPGGA